MGLFNESELNDFGAKIGIPNDLPTFINDFLRFINIDYPEIYNFYSGNSKTLDEVNYKNYLAVLEYSKFISSKIFISDGLLKTYKDWQFVDYFEDLLSELQFMGKIGKFLRSSKTNYNFSGEVEFPYTLGANETLEQVSSSIAGDEDYQNDWVDIAIRNDLDEIKYNKNGGNNLSINVNLTSENSNIKGVIDIMVGSNILGKDIKKELTFYDDDVLVLSPDDTAFQSVVILSNLFKGDCPENLTFGRTRIIGNTKHTTALSTTVRELVETFTSDDTLKNFKVKEIEESRGDIDIVFEIDTVSAKILKNNITV